MPKIRLIMAVKIRINGRFPPEMNSTNSVMTSPIPVRVTVPTTIPAAAVATPIPIIFRAPETKPFIRSFIPCLNENASSLVLRKKPFMGRWVITIKIISTEAQKAESDGENRSTVRHHISTTTGSRK